MEKKKLIADGQRKMKRFQKYEEGQGKKTPLKL
jgi:hypothetical protein